MEKEVPELITVEAARDSHRWVAITALLLAIGVILHTISPNVGGVTPNWTIAMYSITTNLTHPGLLRALGTGICGRAYHCAFFQIGISFGQHCQ